MRSFDTCFEELAVIIFLVLLLAVIEIAAGCRSSRPFAPFSNAEDEHALLYQTCGVLYMESRLLHSPITATKVCIVF